MADKLMNTIPSASTWCLRRASVAGDRLFKYTRLEVSTVLALIASGETVEQVVRACARSQLTPKAVKEAIHLADQALVRATQTLQPAAA